MLVRSVKPVMALLILGVGLGLVLAKLLNSLRLEAAGSLMVPAAALATCGAMLFALTIYHAVRGRVWAISVYTGLLIFVMDATFRTRDLQDVSMDWQSILKLLLWIGALVIGIAHFPKTHKLMLRSVSILMLFYGIWAIFSFVYSDSRVLTLGAAVSLMCLIVFAPVVVQSLTLKQLIMTVCISLSGFILISWFAYLFLPDLGRTTFTFNHGMVYRMSGIAGKPTNLGRLAALLIGFLYLSVIHGYVRMKVVWLPVVLSAAALLISQTRTALIALVVVLGIIHFRKKPWTLYAFITGCAGAVLLFQLYNPGLSMESLLAPLSRSGNIEEITTLTQRTDIWSFVLDKIKEAPWIGHGYASSRLLISEGYASRWGWTTGSSHNMILQNLLTTGIIGTFLVMILLIRQGIDLFRRPMAMGDFIFLFVFINGMMEAILLGTVPGVFTLMWLISIYWREKT